MNNVIADGNLGFSKLNEVIDRLELMQIEKNKFENLRDLSKACQIYLKFDFKTNLNWNSNCKSHGVYFALSDDKDKLFFTECNHEHVNNCNKCDNIYYLIGTVKSFVNDSLKSDQIREKNEMIYELNIAEEQILNWRNHVIRAWCQDQIKNEVIKKLSNDTDIYIHFDWAMKFIMLFQRETGTILWKKGH